VIILSGVLVVLAIALLVTGIVMGNTGHEVLGLDGLKLIYISIGVSIVSALFLAIGVFIRRKDLFGTATPGKAPARTRKTRRPVRAKAKVAVPAATVPPPPAPRVPGETTVFIVPGRKRYHLDTCRQLAGRDREELTFSEAREEGFTPCTACLPDTALAARAAHADTAPPGAEPETAEVTRTDLPVTADEPEPGSAEGETAPARAFFEPLEDAEADRGEKGAADGSTSVRVLSGTKRYHLPDCALIEDIADDADDMETLPLSEAQDGGYTPCLVCQPDKRLGD
jgi:hypothetical protein